MAVPFERVDLGVFVEGSFSSGGSKYMGTSGKQVLGARLVGLALWCS